ncbi:ABC transporter substrate-binding protein [Halopseudomonas laoshanensis]|uniref:ABC transporter substrate-binding protein n=1 Tax=Halopseudomonas laoshanensis TaxID=2268758 RepID=A0A7V7GWJ2_9GAMM|nr:transporter substrate-binding domain-containing protein [Halopseudomonas laoshanensis]KAA0696304.1 ABC transporter substrate-binding protein [Halopseudomonas laoshanensis]
MKILIGRSALSRSCSTLVLVVLACWSNLAAAHCEKTLRWDDDPPFSMQLPNGDISGIDVELNRAVLGHLDCTVTLRKLPWARALRELELGRLDILPGAFRRPERAKYAHFSGAVLPASHNILFMNEEALAKWPVTRLLDLRDTEFRLGAQIRVYYGSDFQEVMNDPEFAARVTILAKRENLWRMLDRGRIDGVIANEHTGAYEIRQLGLGRRIKATNVVVSHEPAEVAFSKESNDLDFVGDYAEALQQLVADGSYEQIVQRYVPKE